MTLERISKKAVGSALNNRIKLHLVIGRYDFGLGYNFAADLGPSMGYYDAAPTIPELLKSARTYYGNIEIYPDILEEAGQELIGFLLRSRQAAQALRRAVGY
jgi:UTP:GlnB (protein PII) uridylyltransferase